MEKKRNSYVTGISVMLCISTKQGVNYKIIEVLVTMKGHDSNPSKPLKFQNFVPIQLKDDLHKLYNSVNELCTLKFQPKLLLLLKLLVIKMMTDGWSLIMTG